MEDNCGYDNEFVDGLPDYLKCAICCLALRNPIQLISCGHRFCKACFEGMKEHSLQHDAEVLCPIDRNKVDTSKVFEDKGIERLVFDLQVKCPRNIEGCTWIGELRNIEAHVRHKCNFEEKKRIQLILKDVQKRLERCEKQLVDKEKCIGDMREEFDVAKNKVNENMKVLQGQFECCQKELTETRVELNLLKGNQQSEYTDNRKKRKRTRSVDLGTMECSTSSGTQVDLPQNLSSDKEQNIQPVETGLKDVILEEQFKKMFEEVKIFEEKVSIVKQVTSNEMIMYKWPLKEYSKHRKKSFAVSPCFYAGSHGHCCRLRLDWIGEQQSILGIFFQLMTLNKKDRNPFRMSIELAIASKTGLKKPFFMSCSFIREHQANFEDPGSGGKKEFIKMPELEDFVINDSMSITCKLIPSIS